jgi:sugar lactone lactonase YvrE
MDPVIASEATQSPADKAVRGAMQSRRRNLAILAVILLALGLRIWAAWQLPVDYDEPIYVEGAYDYAELIRAGDWQGLIDYSKVSEHPPLTRLLYAAVLLASKNGLAWEQALFASRMVSVVLGTLGVAVVAVFDPLAGFLLAVQTLAVKYTGQAYLEATALFTALLALFAMLRSRKLGDGWFWLSAAALGLTAAAKYSYFPILFVILYIAWWQKRYRSPILLAYLGVAALSFFVFDPHLWHQPLQRLIDSLLFHQQYALGEHVQEVAYPWYKPFNWVSRSHGYIWHPDVFFYMGIDGLIFLLTLYGSYLEWGKRRWVVVWLGIGMLFLLVWPTKWPQYTLVVIPAFCLAASSAVRDVYHRLQEQETYWGWFSNMFPRPSRRYITVVAAFVGLCILIIALNTAILTYNRLNWTTVTKENSGLPNNAVNDLLPLPDGRMLVATDAGVAFWQAAGAEDLQDKWQVLTPENSGLPSRRVLSLARSGDGVLWFGTLAGLARYDGQSWQVFRAADMGLGSEQINDLVADQGSLWVASEAGAALYDGVSWTAFTAENSGLTDSAVFALAVQPLTQGERVWFGTLTGVVSYNTQTGAWLPASTAQVGVGWGGVSDLLVDSGGRLWVATLGGGISLWDGSAWSYLRASNSDLPYSTVADVEETSPGVYWIATSLPAQAGGVVSRLEGEVWHTYKPIFSGYTGAETISIARDSLERMWFGTRTEGIYLFEEKK